MRPLILRPYPRASPPCAIPVVAIEDTDTEGDETINVMLNAASAYTMDAIHTSASITLRDNDFAPYSLPDGISYFKFTKGIRGLPRHGNYEVIFSGSRFYSINILDYPGVGTDEGISTGTYTYQRNGPVTGRIVLTGSWYGSLQLDAVYIDLTFTSAFKAKWILQAYDNYSGQELDGAGTIAFA